MKPTACQSDIAPFHIAPLNIQPPSPQIDSTTAALPMALLMDPPICLQSATDEQSPPASSPDVQTAVAARQEEPGALAYYINHYKVRVHIIAQSPPCLAKGAH